MDDLAGEKRLAAARAAALVEPGMRLGLGSGSTAAEFVRALAARVADGLEVLCVATSEATAALAQEHGLALTDLEGVARLDLTVDGTDEVDGELRLIKGGGGALLREKIVAAASERLVVIADRTKRVETLGSFPLPVEIARFGWTATARAVGAALPEHAEGASWMLRDHDGAPFLTDEGHYIIDCACRRIADPEGLAAALAQIPGVVEHGLFLGMAERALIGGAEEIVP